MAHKFPIQPTTRWTRESEPVKRPKEFACFSYDANHEYHPGAGSLRWYYPPQLGADLSKGYEQFVKHDDSKDEHLDSLLKTIMNHEKETGKPIDAHVVTWRGMMTKIMSAPFEDRDGFEMNATLYRGSIFIEEDHEYKQAQRRAQDAQPWKNPIPQEVMQFWVNGLVGEKSATFFVRRLTELTFSGYKFETLSTIPAPWGDVSRDSIEKRDEEVVNNNEQYCSVVRTGLGQTVLCLGGEVDAIWDSKPADPGAPINWVELKTTAEIRSDRDLDNFERKLMKFWIQSFLLGVPKIIVGFRSRDGVLMKVQELETVNIPATVAKRGRAGWNGDACINFASAFLKWLRDTMDDDGVWRIRRRPRSPEIELFKVEETGHGDIVTEEFMNWRIKLSLGNVGSS